MNLLRHLILVVALVLFSSCLASAQQSTATPTATATPAAATPLPVTSRAPSPELKVTAVYCSPPPVENKPGDICEAGIGDTIVIVVEGLSNSVKNGDTKTGDLVLYLGGNPLKDVKAKPIDDPALNRLAFVLDRTDSSSPAWSDLLAKAELKPTVEETVSVGAADKQALPFGDPNQPPKITLRVYNRRWAIFALAGLLLTLGLFVFLAKTTGVIRDSGPPQLAYKQRPYSLSRVQAAFWFFLVIGSFILLYLITGDYNTITDQALILMGIGTGTALGSAMIDATKNDTANNALSELNPQRARLKTEVEELLKKQTDLEDTIQNVGAAATADDKQALRDTKAEHSGKDAELKETSKKITAAESGMTKPASEGFGKDLLTDVDGINFHRFQMVVWTIVLGFLFCIGVYKQLAMPAFSGTLLALMGISSGTYLGFKIPEKQN
jgi:hypothetical protein